MHNAEPMEIVKMRMWMVGKFDKTFFMSKISLGIECYSCIAHPNGTPLGERKVCHNVGINPRLCVN